MIKSRVQGLLIFCNLLLLASARADRQAGYDELVILRTSDAKVLAAAASLADILEKTTGQRPEIRRQRLIEFRRTVLIGAAPEHPAFDADPLTDEVLVERTSAGLEIRGSDNTATCFAIYRFIEVFLGWRYYQPGDLGLERLDDPPPIPAIDGQAGMLLLERSGFHSRNLTGITTTGTGISWADWHCLREKFEYNHRLHRVVTPDLFETDPELFAKQADGEPGRPPYPVTHGHNDHPDLSNPGVRRLAVADFMDRYTGSAISSATATHSLSLADSFEFGWVPGDYEWKPAGYFRRWPDWSNHVFDYTNAVATDIQAYWNRLYDGVPEPPPLYLGALSYLTWEKPPDFPLHPSIVPYLTYDRSQWYDPVARQDDLANVQAWAAKDTRVLGTWDYLFGYGFLMPRSLVEIVSESIPRLHQHGVRAYFSQVEPVWPFDLHTTWLTSRLLWDPDADATKLMDEFYREFYGPAEPFMREFFAAAEQTWMQQDQAAEKPATGGTGKAPGRWLRYWKDPWQAALWKAEDLQNMENLLGNALNHTLSGHQQRFHDRVRQTARLFAVTRAFVDYQHSAWALQSAKPDADSIDPMGDRNRLDQELSSVLETFPMAAKASDLSWIDRYDATGGYLLKRARASNLRRQQLEDWCRRQGFTGQPDLDVRPQEIRLPELKTLGTPGKWKLSLLDSENASIIPLAGKDGLLAESVRRGHAYQAFRVQAGQFLLAQADVETGQSPSGEVYIRIDFFDRDFQLIGSSNRSRAAPSQLYGKNQQLRVLAQAPNGATAARMVIRFYEMDRDSRIIVANPRLFRMGSVPFR